MLEYMKDYQTWVDKANSETKAELQNLSDEEIKDRFCKHLEFGTGGLRGIMGAGTNRMNEYVVARASQGLADYIKANSEDLSKESVIIAYDSRNFSEIFARKSANVLSGNGIKVYIFDELRPTPELSFAIRHKKATAGIVITASHNPANYNGYKVYWSDGGQIIPEIAEKIQTYIEVTDIFGVCCEADESKIVVIGKEVDDAYIENVYAQSVNPNVKKDDFGLIYTPLHGSGNKPVRRIFERSGFKNVLIVKSQELPDGNFPTVKSPNPENKECFELAISLAKENNINLIVGTDPDCDRVGIVAKRINGEYEPLTGNQVGILLLNYILSSKKNYRNPAVVTTIVSTKMADCICKKYGVKLFRTLTGFKYIGEKIKEFEINNSYSYVFGFEESCGYLKGTYARDKDAVVSSMLIAEMTAYYAEQGLGLHDVLKNLYDEFGGFCEELECITYEGAEGTKKINHIMSVFRNSPKDRFETFKITKFADYLENTDLPKSDVLYFGLENGVDFVVRPSGTEPKIKIYYLSKGDSYDDAKEKIKEIKRIVNKVINKFD